MKKDILNPTPGYNTFLENLFTTKKNRFLSRFIMLFAFVAFGFGAIAQTPCNTTKITTVTDCAPYTWSVNGAVYNTSGSYSYTSPEVIPTPRTLNVLDRTVTYNNVSINGGTNSATVLPGATVTIGYDMAVTFNGGQCPGCITQAYIGIGGTSTTISCESHIYDGFSSSYTMSPISFTAPTTPGVYYITQTGTWDFSCVSVSFNNLPSSAIGSIIVGCSQTEILNLTISNNNTWTGATSSDWNIQSNWSCGIPNATSDVTIPSGTTNPCVIKMDSIAQVHNITLASGVTLVNDGTLNVNGGGTATLNGTYKGKGAYTGAVFTNTGTVAPGASPGCLTFGSGFTNVGTLNIEVEGTTPCIEHDQLQVTGTATLGGTLDVQFTSSFVPVCGQSYTIITATGGVSGTFATTTLPTMPTGMTMSVVYNPNDVTLTVTGTPVATATPASQSKCAGVPISDIVLTSTVANTTYAWTRDNSGTTPGIAASGSGTPITGTLTNATASPVTSTFTITPTSGTCVGANITAMVMVNPTPTVTAGAVPGGAGICINEDAEFIINGTSGDVVEYNINSGATQTITLTGATTALPVIVNPMLDQHLRITKVTSPAGCSQSFTPGSSGPQYQLIEYQQSTIAGTGPLNVCVGKTFTLSASPNATSGVWTSNNGNATTTAGTGASNVITGAVAGVSIITLTNNDGCTSTRTINVHGLPTVSISPSMPTVCENSSVTLTANGTVGTTYSWDNPAASMAATMTETPPSTGATYTVTVTDGNSCTNTASASVNVNPAPAVTAMASAASICAGDTTVLTGGGATSYTWDNGVTDGVAFAPTATTTYVVTGTDTNGCTNTDTLMITVNGLPTITASVCEIGPSSTPSTPTAVPFVTTGLNSPFDIAIDGTDIYVSDYNGNSISKIDMTATSPAATTYVTGTNNPFGIAIDGTDIYVSDYFGNSISKIDMTATTPTATTYVTGLSRPYGITIDGTYMYVANRGTNSILRIDITATTPTATPYITGLSGPTYIAIDGTDMYVTSETGNSVSKIDMTATSPAATTYINTGLSSPAGIAIDGTDMYVANFGSSSISKINMIATPPTATTYVTGLNLPIGIAMDGTDMYVANRGTNSISKISLVPTAPCAKTDTICRNETVKLSATGGTSYTWTPTTYLTNVGADTARATPDSSTAYIVTGTDANGCVNTDTATVVVNQLPLVAVTPSTDSICQGSSTTLTASGASTYAWNNTAASTTAAITESPTADTSYIVTGTDANGCANTDTASIHIYSLPTLSGADTICSNTTTQLTASATANATTPWVSSDSTVATVDATGLVTGVAPGATTITFTDENGCQTDTLITVNGLPDLSITQSPTSTVCAGSEVTLTAVDNNDTTTMFTWDNGITNATPFVINSSTTYIVSATDSNSCVNTDTILVVVNNLPTLTLSKTTDTVCIGDTIVAPTSMTTGNGVTWMPALVEGDSFILNASTTYTATAVDAIGCQKVDSFVAIARALPMVTASNDTTCVGTMLTLNAMPATLTSYAWAGPVAMGTGNPFTVSNVTAADAGTYTVTGTDAHGCSNTATATAVINALPTITANATDTTVCENDQITLYGSGAHTYTWNNGVTDSIQFAPPVGTTAYVVTGEDTNGCTSTDTITIKVNPLPMVAASTSAASVCGGATVTWTASGADTYVWDNGSNSTTASFTETIYAATTYIVIGTDTNGCVNTDTATADVFAQPSIMANLSLTSGNAFNTVCEGDSVILYGSGASSYVWSSTNPNAPMVTDSVAFAALATTTFDVVGTDTNGCMDTTSILVNVKVLPIVMLSSNTDTVCAGTSMTTPSLDGSSNATNYTWSPTSPALSFGQPFTLDSTSTFVVTGTDIVGCEAKDTFNAVALANPVLTTTSDTVCENGSLTLSVQAGFSSYYWSGPGNDTSNTDMLTINPMTISDTGTYTVQVSDASGCYATATAYAGVYTLPTVMANTTDTAVCAGTTVTLTGSGSTATYTWDNSVTDGTAFAPTATASYTVTATDSNNCSASDSISVTVNQLPMVTASTTADTICTGAMVTLTGGGTTGYTWDNSVTDGVAFAPTATTTYTVTGTDTNNCSAMDTVEVVVNAVPAAPTVTTVDPVCATSNGTITITAPTGAAYMYSIDDTTYQSGTSFSAPAGTYSITARTTGLGCTSTATIDSLNANSAPCIPNLAAGTQTVSPSINIGDSTVVNYFVTNIGTTPTTGALITINITKPTNGTLTMTAPAGWNMTSTASLITLTSTAVIQPGFSNGVTLPAVYTHDGTNQSALKGSLMFITSGSGGETDGTNNNGGAYIQVN